MITVPMLFWGLVFEPGNPLKNKKKKLRIKINGGHYFQQQTWSKFLIKNEGMFEL
jgi:hypothetical protein